MRAQSLVAYESSVVVGNMHIGFGERHLQIVEEGAHEGPGAIHLLQLFQACRLLTDVLLKCSPHAIPAWQDEAALHPGEDPGDSAQFLDSAPHRSAGGPRADIEPAQFQNGCGLLEERQKLRILSALPPMLLRPPLARRSIDQ